MKIEMPKHTILLLSTHRSGTHFLVKGIHQLSLLFQDIHVDQWNGKFASKFVLIRNHLGKWGNFPQYWEILKELLPQAEKVIFHTRELKYIAMSDIVRTQYKKQAPFPLPEIKLSVFKEKIDNLRKNYERYYDFVHRFVNKEKLEYTHFFELDRSRFIFLDMLERIVGYKLTANVFFENAWDPTNYDEVPNIKELLVYEHKSKHANNN